MFPVSDAFLTAVKVNTRKYYWTGRITTKAGAVYDFGPEDIVKGSGYLTAQCCGSAEIELGTVHAAEMGISLFSDIDRYTLMDAVVTLAYHLRISESRDSEELDPEYEQTVESDGIERITELVKNDVLNKEDRDNIFRVCLAACG